MALRKFSVSELKKIYFPLLPLEKKMEIKLGGKPTPELNISIVCKARDRSFKRLFRPEMYEKNEWICGCDETNRLYCFACLLMAKVRGDISWVNYGVSDLAHLNYKMKKHECTELHLNSILELHMLGKADIRQQLDNTCRLNVRRHNEHVTKNRLVLSKLIDCIKSCSAFELALTRLDNQDSASSGVFRRAMNFTNELDAFFKDHLPNLAVYKGTPKDIEGDLLDCMFTVCQNHIKNEISQAQFVSVIADETTDISAIFQLAIIFRYISNIGEPVERFWVFTKPSGCDSTSVAKCIIKAVEDAVDDPGKIISQSYDGASVMSGHLAGVQAIIQSIYKNAFFVHCYAQQVHSIVSQAASKNQQIRVFFSNLTDITNFFNNERSNILDELIREKFFVGVGVPKPSARLNLKINAVNTVYEIRLQLIKYMKKIESSSKQHTSINQAGNIRRMLQDSTFVFWLTVFHNIMPQADLLHHELQKKSVDAEKIEKAVNALQVSIEKERKKIDSFDHQPTESEVTESETENKKKDNKGTNAVKKMCEHITKQIKTTFSFTAHYYAGSLFNSKLFCLYEAAFPALLIDRTSATYKFLDKDRLKSELKVIYGQPDFRYLTDSVSLLQFLAYNNLHTTFTETYKLLLIICTIPTKPVDSESCSTFKKVKTFLRTVMNHDRMSALVMLSTQNDMINSIPNFNGKVIDLFASKKDRRTDFVYRSYRPPFELVECGEEPIMGYEEQVPPVRHASILESILEKPKATGRKRASSEKKRKRKEEKAAATVTQTTNGDVTSHDVNAETLSSVDATQLKEEMQEALTKRLRVEEQNNDIVVGGSTSSEQFAEVLIKEEVMLVDAPMAKNVFGEEEELPIIEIKKECSIEDEYNPLDAATTMEEH